ncbi:MAG: methyltransferase domain-containing protein [Solirubrobacteraceae bacterium]
MSIARDWDGTTYDRISAPMEEMGIAVLDRLELCGDETVIDAGCGSGRITEELLRRLPRGRVIGVDGSASMVAAARERLGERDDLELLVADLTELDLGGVRADAILSTATFHWIADHATLFARLRGALRDGGRLVAQCGGEGNIAAVHEAAARAGAEDPFAEHFATWVGPWRFAGPGETEDLLRAAGFRTARAWLGEWPVTPEDPATWLRTIVLGSHLERLPEELREPFVQAVLARLPRPVVIPYVRLNLDATA